MQANQIEQFKQIKLTLSRVIGPLSVLVMLSAGAFADTSVWVATKGDDKVYLGGTIHLLRSSDYPLPEEFEQAYQDSDRLFFETNISEMTSLSVQTSMLQQLTYTDGRTLKTVLSEEAYQALNEYLTNVGLPIMMLESMKPGLIISTIQVLEFQKLGFTPQGVDMYFNSRAMGDAKPVGQLETVQEQIQFLADMGVGYESEFILMSLEDLEEVATSMDALVTAWRDGDMDELDEVFVTDMREQSEPLYNALLLDRNRNWLPLIEQMFNEEGNEFVLVGAAHLVGEGGLVEMLSARGYELRQL